MHIIFRLTFLMLAGVAIALPGYSTAADRFALLIGNEKYAESVGPLKTPHQDVAKMAATLSSLGFKVTTVKDATFKDLHAAVANHIEDVQGSAGKAISFVYFAGHGASNVKTKANYLIPTDVSATDEKLWANSINLQTDIIDKLRSLAPSAAHIVVFDACRNELRLTNKDRAFEVGGKAFFPARYTPGMLIAYSTEEGSTASDSGMYATLLSSRLMTKDEEIVTVFRRVQISIQEKIGQMPFTLIQGLPEIYLAQTAGTQLPRARPSIMRGPETQVVSVPVSPPVSDAQCAVIPFMDYSRVPPTMQMRTIC